MPETGWTGEAPEPESPGGFTGFLAAQRQDPAEGRTLEEVMNRSRSDRDPRPEHRDQDAEMANLMARGYQPGASTLLGRRLADAQAELAAVREANEKARRQHARIARDHQAGKITAFDIMRMDFGEPDRAAEQRLERRVQSLQGQLAEMSARISPGPEREPDAVEAATSRAHRAFAEATRAMLDGVPAKREPRPFDSGGGEGAEVPDCPACRDLMRSARRPATAAEAAEIHRQAAALQAADAAGDWLPCRVCAMPADQCVCSLAVR